MKMKNKDHNENKRSLTGRQLEVLGLILIILSVLFAMSFASYSPRDELIMNHYSLIDNTMGIAGVFISYFFIKLGVGWFAWGFVPLLFAWGLFTLFRWDKRILKRCTWFGLGLILLLSILFSIGPLAQNGLHAETGFIPGGFVGGTFAVFLSDWLGVVPAIIATIAAVLILISGFFRFSLTAPFKSLRSGEKNTAERKNRFRWLKKKREKEKITEKPPEEAPKDFFPPDDTMRKEDVIEPPREKVRSRNAEIAEKEKIRPQKKKERKMNERPYMLPSADLLTEAPDNGGYNESELRQKADKLTKTLAEFGVEGRVTRIIPGPVITMYEVEPGTGVRVNKIVNLEDDIARVMAAKHVRIVAPIPGKTVVGVEIPNRHPELIHYHSIINSTPFVQAKGLLTIAVGKTAEGIPFTFDLDKMPHLLVAGTTGSGKSVCLNTIIMSILFRATPDEVKFIRVDPKKIALSIDQALEPYHLITSEDVDEYVITNAQNAIYALRSAVVEMEERYDILLKNKVRDISEYNAKIRHSSEAPMPYIVVVIDELADLMVNSAGRTEIEQPIQRLAQKARAVGIHLVVATQRPSVDVITGVIRSNFPARIAFNVATKTDSRTILDVNGAEKLLGRGDMLYLPPGRSDPLRLHNAYISLEEIENVLEHICRQPKKEDDYVLPTAIEEEEEDDFDPFNNGDRDPLFNEAMQLVIAHQQGSASLLQRRRKVGYSRAGRLIDQLEEAKIVGPPMGSKAREVMVGPDYFEDDENEG